VCMANALFQIPHMDVSVYEAAPEFSERGAAVALSGLAQDGLNRILPSASKTFADAGAVPMNSVRLLIVSCRCLSQPNPYDTGHRY
jgi:salicylate hydroxylase